MFFVYSLGQAVAAQPETSIIQIFVGHYRDCDTGDPEVQAALGKGAIRNKRKVFTLLGVDNIICPLKILKVLKESVTSPEEKYSLLGWLAPQATAPYNFSNDEIGGFLSKGCAPGGIDAALDVVVYIRLFRSKSEIAHKYTILGMMLIIVMVVDYVPHYQWLILWSVAPVIPSWKSKSEMLRHFSSLSLEDKTIFMEGGVDRDLPNIRTAPPNDQEEAESARSSSAPSDAAITKSR